MPIIVNGTTLNNVDVGGANIQKVYARQGETGTYVLVFEKGGVVTVALWFGGNWKMNNLKANIDAFFNTFNSALTLDESKKVVIFPPACYLDYVKSKIASSLSNMVEVGIQNVFYETKGAYTGEISALMAEDCGCTHAMVGHSEQRQYFGVTNETCNKTVKSILANTSMTAWLFVGETLEIREAGNEDAYVQNELQECLTGVSPSDIETGRVVICYEPIWAIGTGLTCSAADAQLMMDVIKSKIAEMYGDQAAQKIAKVYGGSVKASNINDILMQPDISGVSAGGVSLKAANFAEMINVAAE